MSPTKAGLAPNRYRPMRSVQGHGSRVAVHLAVLMVVRVNHGVGGPTVPAGNDERVKIRSLLSLAILDDISTNELLRIGDTVEKVLLEALEVMVWSAAACTILRSRGG